MKISAKIIEDSITTYGGRITTMELEYPRFIHSEFMTHRVFSRNASSSRAIPAKKIREQVWRNPAMPVSWGENKSGMQASKDLSRGKKSICRGLWKLAAKAACGFHFAMEKAGLHKQLCNRILEPWQMMKVVVTATEWANFLWLRDHPAAQPEIAKLASCVSNAFKMSAPTPLRIGQWHLPYVSGYDRKTLSLENQIALSVSCCAQVSYRKLDTSITKAKRIGHMLVSDSRIHASPFEHQAQAISSDMCRSAAFAKKTGMTHVDVDGQWWSGNLRGWVQNRQRIDGHNKTELPEVA